MDGTESNLSKKKNLLDMGVLTKLDSQSQQDEETRTVPWGYVSTKSPYTGFVLTIFYLLVILRKLKIWERRSDSPHLGHMPPTGG